MMDTLDQVKIMCPKCEHTQQMHTWRATPTLVYTEDWICTQPGCICVNANEDEIVEEPNDL